MSHVGSHMTMNRPAALPARRYSAMPAVWLAYDVCLALLALLLATEALNRFGISSPLWALVYAMTFFRIALVLNAFTNVVFRNAVLLIYPTTCLMSVAWSVEPKISLVSSLQLFVTIIIGLTIGARFKLRSIVLFILVIVGITVFLSLVNWATGIFGPAYAGSGGFLGIYTQKNVLGQRCLIALLAGLVIPLTPGREGLIMRAGVLGIAVMIVFALILSKSATSTILVVPFAVALVILCSHRLNRGLFAVTLTFGIVAIGTVPLIMALLDLNPVTLILDAFGKDSTLTGRTSLWDIGEAVIAKNAWLGVGYLAFWRSGEFANMALLAQHIGGEAIMAFHNLVLEIWVGTGLPGLIGIFLFTCTCLYRSTSLYLQTRDVSAAFAMMAVSASIVLSLFEPSLYRQHDFVILICAMLATSSGEDRRRLSLSSRGATKQIT